MAGANILKIMTDEPMTFSELRELCLLPSEELEELLKRLEAEGKVRSNAIIAAGVNVYWTPQLFSSPSSSERETTGAGAISQVTPRPMKRRYPFNNRGSSKLRQPFRSPMQYRNPTPSTHKKDNNFEQEIANLKEKRHQLNDEIRELRKDYHEDELQDHIDKLHEYNEIKDIGQLLIGKLAELSGTTTKSMYEEFGLDLKD